MDKINKQLPLESNAVFLLFLESTGLFSGDYFLKNLYLYFKTAYFKTKNKTKQIKQINIQILEQNIIVSISIIDRALPGQ